MPISGPDTPDTKGPALRVPPPVIVAGLCTLGWLLMRLVPLHFVPPAATLGGLVIAGGLLLAGAAVVVMRQAGTSVRPDRPNATLVERGPFRFSRNPIYLAFVLVAVGLALMWGDAWPWLAAAGCFVLLHRFAVLPEEAYLRSRFGEAYVNYAGRVSRWL